MNVGEGGDSIIHVGDAMSTLGFPILMKGCYPLASPHKPLYPLDVLMTSPPT